MTASDVLAFAVGALRGHRLRTALSTLGVSIGVSAVIALTALGDGARRYVTDQFVSLGTNLLVVIPGKVETTGAFPGMGGGAKDLTIGDALAIQREVSLLKAVAPVSMGTETVSAGERSRQVPVIGTTFEMLEVRNLHLGSGSFLPRTDWDRGTPVAVLGHGLPRELFPGVEPVGQTIRIGDARFRVVGVLAARGVNVGLDLDKLLFIPVASGMRLFNRSSLFRILMEFHSHADVEPVKAAVRQVLMRRHDGEEDFTLITEDAVISAFSSIFTALTLALSGIAAVSLSVAGIGIMNVMLVSVSERTSEIGLLKAVGAQREHVLAVFLMEAVILSTVGGLIGIALGWSAVKAFTALYPTFSARPPLWAVVAAAATSAVVGAVFGLLPAYRATRLDPVAAIRRG